MCRVLHRPVDDYIEQDRLAGVSWSKNRLFTAECPFLSLENQYKPDGLDIIDHTNVLDIYKCVSLLDLNGINTRFQARLNAAGIFTPMEFYQAPLELLKKQVFQSILGYYWYLRLRGHEIDAVDFKRKSFGNTYALQKQTNDQRELAKLLIKLCEKTGRRLRRANYSA